MDLTHRLPVRDRWLVPAVIFATLVAGLGVGRILVIRGTPEALALAVFPAFVVFLLRSVWVGYAAVIAVLALLPFAVLPAGTTVTPAVLELSLLASFATIGGVVLLDRRQAIRVSGPLSLVIALVGVTAFALVLGLGRGYTAQTLHDYAKFVLAIGAFWLTVQLVVDRASARRVLSLLLLGTGGAAAIGLALYSGGPELTERVLVRLVPYGYPGSRIVRFIEDDPLRAMRAVGTSVDPNSYGGLLMVGFVLAVGQILVRKRSIPLWLALGVAAATGASMLLTYSRGAWVGAFVGVVLVVLLRRPKLVVPMAGLAVAVIAAGLGSGFVQRLWLGFTLQDPATKLRLSEYRNAWEIIRQHPWFGVGFGDAPSIELQTGVSSVYLTVAERAGLIGLLVFLVVMGVVFWRGIRLSLRYRETEINDLVLCFTAALASALAVGLVDHYFFNPQFPHMAALLWIVAGVIVGLTDRGHPDASRNERAVLSSLRHDDDRTGSVTGRWTT